MKLERLAQLKSKYAVTGFNYQVEAVEMINEIERLRTQATAFRTALEFVQANIKRAATLEFVQETSGQVVEKVLTNHPEIEE
jgi:hypothetical protein